MGTVQDQYSRNHGSVVVHVCTSQKAPLEMSDRHPNTRIVGACWCFNQPSPFQLPQLRKPKANPKEVTRSKAQHCHYHTRSTQTSKQVQDGKNSPVLLWFLHKGVVRIPAPSSGSGSVLLKKKIFFAGQHPTRSFWSWPSHEHQAGSRNLQNYFKFSFLYLGRKTLQAVSVIRIANISLKRKSLN